jgi:hypothetical protein
MLDVFLGRILAGLDPVVGLRDGRGRGDGGGREDGKACHRSVRRTFLQMLR